MDIVNTIASKVKLYKHNNLLIGLCPFHEEKNPSLIVNPAEGTFRCLSCGAHGDASDFIAKYAHVPRHAVLRYTAEEKSEKFNQRFSDANRMAAEYYHFRLTHAKSANSALEYLKRRGLKEKTIEDFCLGASGGYGRKLIEHLEKKGFSEEELLDAGLAFRNQKDGEVYDRFFNRVMFPFRNENGEYVGFTGRAIDPESEDRMKYSNTPGTEIFHKKEFLYGFDTAKDAREDYFILVEGNMDVISLHQAGFESAVASSGTALTEEHCLMLRKYKERVVLMYDSDEPGIKAAKKAVPMMREAGLSVIIATAAPCKDPDELVKKAGASGVTDALRSAVGSAEFLAVHAADPKEALQIMKHNFRKFIRN